MTTTIDVFGVGNAMVDSEYLVNDVFLDAFDISKGHMQLIDASRLSLLLEELPDEPRARCSGGSVANSIYACRGFGCSTHLTCRIAKDNSGEHFKNDLSSVDIGCSKFADDADKHSGHCLVLITPDAERTLNTCLGVSEFLSPPQLDEEVLRNSKCLYIEGYLASSPSGSETAILAHELAESEGIDASLTLSDVSMIEFFGSNLKRILGNGIDRLFCNEEEALFWCKTDRIDIAMRELMDLARNVHVTMSGRGSMVNEHNKIHEVSGFVVDLVDVSGAGDIYAGGVLAAVSQGAGNVEATRFGNFVASNLVTRFGARLDSIAEYQKLHQSFSRFKN